LKERASKLLNEKEVLDWLKERSFESFMNELMKDVEEHEPSEDKVTVTELSMECPRAIFFSRIFGEYFARTRNIISLVIGKKLHEISILGKEMEVKVEWNGIVGRIDEYDPTNAIILEKKFVQRTPREPYEHHVKQISYYKLLAIKNNMPVNYTILWYFCFDDLEDPVKVFVVKTPPLDVIEREAIFKREAIVFALKNKKIPARKLGWFCKFCNYSMLCFMDKKYLEKYVSIAAKSGFGKAIFMEV